MGAPKENQFWKLRATHGRKKIFGDPQILWECATNYFQWCDEHPWKETQFHGKDAIECHAPTQRPYTLSGLCVYLSINQGFWYDFKKKGAYKEKGFTEVFMRIEGIIYTQKFEGAAVGAFNANIIARDLGLRDKTDITTDGEKIGMPTTIPINRNDNDGTK